MPKRRKVQYWSEPGRKTAEEFAYTSPMSGDLKEQIGRDEEALVAALSGRNDRATLINCLKRLKTNANCMGFFEGFGTGYGIAKERWSTKPSDNDAMIIDIIKRRPFAGPTEICELIDAYNAKAKDKKERIIELPFRDLKTGDARAWTDRAAIPKVKQRISELKSKAWRSLYASEFQQPRLVDLGEVAQRELARKRAASKKAARRDAAKMDRKLRKS